MTKEELIHRINDLEWYDTAMFRNQAFGVKSEQTIPGTGVEMLNIDSRIKSI